MNDFKNPWEITPEMLKNPWEVGGGRSVLDKEEVEQVQILIFFFSDVF
ncbi:MAG: hypothetical protein RLZZ292_3174 [Bacteroidota bacterium]|jgi:hypothetical protein